MRAVKARVATIVSVLALLAFGAGAFSTARATSAVVDEQLYLGSGLRYWKHGDVSPEVSGGYGPVAPAIVSAPLRIAELLGRIDLPDEPEAIAATLKAREPALLPLARTASIVLALLLGVLVVLAARRLQGSGGGAVAALLFASSPDMLAHGALATTDLPLAAFAFAALASFLSWVRTARRVDLGLFVVTLALAAGCKHSALPFVGAGLAIFLVVLAVWATFFAPCSELARRIEAAPGKGLARTLVKLLACGSLALCLSAALYGTARGPLSAVLEARTSPGSWTLAQPVPAYFQSLAFQLEHARKGHRAYFLGQTSDEGWPAYFVVAIALKWPLPLLLLAGAGAALVARRRDPAHVLAALAFGIPAVVLGVLLSRARLDLGVRYLLPALPAAILLATEGALGLCRSRPGRVVAAVLIAWQVAGAVRTHPDHLAFFNEAASGTGGGATALADSNLDWGQDLPALHDWMRENRVERVSLSWFGSSDPAAWGIENAGFSRGPDGEPVPNAPVIAVSRSIVLLYGAPRCVRRPATLVLRGTILIWDDRPGHRQG